MCSGPIDSIVNRAVDIETDESPATSRTRLRDGELRGQFVDARPQFGNSLARLDIV